MRFIRQHILSIVYYIAYYKFRSEFLLDRTDNNDILSKYLFNLIDKPSKSIYYGNYTF